MKSFKIMVSATALLAALTGCGDDSSKVVAVIDHEGNVATDSIPAKAIQSLLAALQKIAEQK
jgi:hypothetical protein